MRARFILLLVAIASSSAFLLRQIGRHEPPEEPQADSVAETRSAPLPAESNPAHPPGEVAAPRHLVTPHADPESSAKVSGRDRRETGEPEQPQARPPTAGELREDIAKDPHSAPASMLRFAESLGDRMEEAKADEAKADALFAELERCAERGDSPQVQALCIRTAARLNARHRDRFRGRLDELTARAPSEAVRLAR